MPQKLMDVLMLRRCSHEFSWPRRTSAGDYYQVCMLCAAAYRIRLENHAPRQPRRGSCRRYHHRPPPLRPQAAHLDPRARRLKLNIQVRYRGKNLSTWYQGRIQNISQSGVLFHGPQQIPANALIEMIFEMPEAISGQKNCAVLCQARMVRVKDAIDNTEDAFGLAASILDYKILRHLSEGQRQSSSRT